MPSSLPISICAAASSEGIGSLIIEVAERGYVAVTCLLLGTGLLPAFTIIGMLGLIVI